MVAQNGYGWAELTLEVATVTWVWQVLGVLAKMEPAKAEAEAVAENAAAVPGAVLQPPNVGFWSTFGQTMAMAPQMAAQHVSCFTSNLFSSLKVCNGMQRYVTVCNGM